MAPTLPELQELLPDASVELAVSVSSRDDAIRRVGALLVRAGAVEPGYVDHMLEREASVSTFVGDGVAMPHGTVTDDSEVLQEGLSVLVLAEPVDWAGETVSVVIGIAAHGRDYIALLSQLASELLRDGRVAELSAANTPRAVRELLAGD
jgi:PTS system mannitol-specific IIA component